MLDSSATTSTSSCWRNACSVHAASLPPLQHSRTGLRWGTSGRRDIAQFPRAAGEQAQALLEHRAGDRGDNDPVDVQVVLAAFDRRCRVGGAEGRVEIGGASWRARVCTSVYIMVVGLQIKNITNKTQ